MAKAFLIAAPWSNSGKTTITLGLARYFSNKNYKVQTFKCGPDYIDTMHHSRAAKRPSINLDSVLMSDTHIQEVFTKYTNEADISIVEGVMGLFDGAVKDQGSSAELAKKLNIPVILVVNAKAMAYTIAPILHGLKSFDPEVKIAGVLFNFVKTESHYTFLKEACETVGIPSLGYIPPNDDIKIPSRHLGLHIEDKFEELIERAASHIGTHTNIHELLNIATSIKKTKVESLTNGINPIGFEEKIETKLKIAVAKDEAFTFTYVENLAYLKQLGDVTFFSPIHDTKLPEADIIYLAGGYPELYLDELSSNAEMKTALKNAAENGIKILAECGGMMYLGNQIINAEGIAYNMIGVFDFSTTMEQKKLHLGYRKVVFEDETIWGHEFHYSSMIHDKYDSIAKIYTAREKEITTKVFSYKNVMASYIHLYWGAGNFNWLTKPNGFSKGINPLDKEYYFVTFATAKSRISDRMVKYNTSSFIRNLDALIFEEDDLKKMMTLFKEAFKRYDVDTVCFNILPDHIHILLRAENEEALTTQIKNIKGYTSYKFQRFKEWEKGIQKVWVQKFHRKRISKTDGSIERVTNYIKNNHYKHEARWGEEMSEFIEALHIQEDN
ncbi:cobyrinate a,c-diamide synthase [Tenacibaculum agarivorans]|uniref:cobyrinate a,c-diamide synthase n=1 Tax=Tenacibaculum agarivorans TaxID=1908389 RepID=UPI00094B8A4A|nr:cobyrinate a,c-diamide synthase [Tenacibaculum agarivorans]